jgi:hypothetical protein
VDSWINSGSFCTLLHRGNLATPHSCGIMYLNWSRRKTCRTIADFLCGMIANFHCGMIADFLYSGNATPVGLCCLQSSTRPTCLNAASFPTYHCGGVAVSLRHMLSYQCGIMAVLSSLGRRCHLIVAASLSSYCYGFIANLFLQDLERLQRNRQLVATSCHIPTPLGSCCSFNEAVRDQLALFLASSPSLSSRPTR